MNRFCFAAIFVYLLMTAAPLRAQESTQPSPASGAQNENESGIAEEQPAENASPQQVEAYPDPNLVPYKTKRSPVVQLFSIPAKLWHLLWTPLGATVIWVEQNRVQEKALNFFLNDDRTGGFFPLISLGGNTGAGAGISIFHYNLFNRGKRINFSFLFSSEDNNTGTLAYTDSSLFGAPVFFNLLAEYFSDSDENLFINSNIPAEQLLDSSIGGNETDVDADETSYKTKQGGFMITTGHAIGSRIGLGIVTGMKRAKMNAGDGPGGGQFPNTIPGSGIHSLFSIGAAMTLDFRNGWPRTLSGTLLRLGYQYNRELNGSQFEFNRYTIELNQFIPVPFLATNRRLALRGMFEKLDRLNDKQIPFYELSLLGDAATLRGFDQNRFRGRGMLLFNLEYRYPVWDTWDAVIFVDEGQVFDDINDVRLDRFHFAAGTGLRFMSPNGFAMRFEVGFSSEAVRALFQITPNF
jgi:outer membrane protein insertion porin family